VTDAIGTYLVRGLPPGVYTVRIELPGAVTVEDQVMVPLGGTAKLDAILQVAGAVESITVKGAVTPPPLAATQTSANVTADVVSALPLGRSPALIAELAPGVTDNVPNAGQLTISGAFAYDNVFLVDGVDTNDNIFGTSNNLFIEEAVQETQVLSSGISAEYGRFSGGVVNVVTKRGGNDFHGSFRTNLSNPAWSDETPFEKASGATRPDVLAKSYEATFGGLVVPDRLWFFAAGRSERSQAPNALREVGTPYAVGTENTRGEIKLTGTVAAGHTVEATYLSNQTSHTDRPSLNANTVDPATLIDREVPNTLWVANWNGLLTDRLTATFQVSKRDFGFLGNGGTSTAIVESPFRTRGVLGVPSGLHYNAPYLSALDPEERDNRQFTGSLSYSATSARLGRHDLKAGFEDFVSTRTGGNSQSATGYVFRSDYVVDGAGRPLLDAAGHPVPRFVGNAANPGAAPSRIEQYISTPGARMDLRTFSLYGQDHWTATPRLGIDAGLRYERVTSEATGGIESAVAHTFVPRLGVTFDPSADGRTILQGTYAHYSGKFSDVQFAANTTVGNPSTVILGYVGPEGQGRDFAPGFDLANYAVIGGAFPTANIFFEDGLSSPVTRELTASVGRELPRGGYLKATWVWRDVERFFEDFIDDPTAAGRTTVVRDGVDFGTFDNLVFRNSNGPERRYQALIVQSRHRVGERLTLDGHWTLQLTNHGTFEGEAANQPGATSGFGDYPEILVPARNFPYGRLDDFQRHKVRVWALYSQPLGRFGALDVAPLLRINSGLTYSLAAANVALSPEQRAANPGYARLPGGGAQTLFFGERGSESFKGYGLVDAAVTYRLAVWKSLAPWVQVQVFNLLDNDKLISWDTTVTPDPNSPKDVNGLPTGYLQGANFGKATRTGNFPAPLSGENGGRTFRLALGVRF
jgi:hypothetical protein